MSSQPQCLKDFVQEQRAKVEAVCSTCGESLGQYWAEGPEGPNEPSVWLTAVKAGRLRTAANTKRGWRGPRTQRRLVSESWSQIDPDRPRHYVRKICDCKVGAKEKRSAQRLADLPVTVRPDGTVVLVF